MNKKREASIKFAALRQITKLALHHVIGGRCNIWGSKTYSYTKTKSNILTTNKD